jgi:hypothetical protein
MISRHLLIGVCENFSGFVKQNTEDVSYKYIPERYINSKIGIH